STTSMSRWIVFSRRSTLRSRAPIRRWCSLCGFMCVLVSSRRKTSRRPVDKEALVRVLAHLARLVEQALQEFLPVTLAVFPVVEDAGVVPLVLEVLLGRAVASHVDGVVEHAVEGRGVLA